MESCWTRQILTLGGFDGNQFMMSSSGHKVPWCPIDRQLSLPRPSNTTEAIFQMLNNSLLQIACNFPIGACQKPHTASSSIRDISNSVRSANSYDQAARIFAPSLDLLQRLLLLKAGRFPCHPVNGLGQYSHWNIPLEYDASKTWRDYQALSFILVVESLRCSNMFLILEEMSWNALDQGPSKFFYIGPESKYFKICGPNSLLQLTYISY